VVCRQSSFARTLGDHLCARTNHDQLLDDLRSTRSNLEVPVAFVGAQLQHVAQHCDLASFEVRQQAQRSHRRRRAGVERIVDDETPIGPTHCDQPQLQTGSSQAFHDLVPCQSFDQARCRATQHRIDAMTAQERRLEGHHLIAVVQPSSDALKAQPFHVVSPQVGLR